MQPLPERGANPAAKSNGGSTALDHAKQNKRAAVVALLEARGKVGEKPTAVAYQTAVKY